jgi:hypothetical protein
MPTKKSVPERERLVRVGAAMGTARPSVRSIQEIGEYNAGFDIGLEGRETTDRRVLHDNMDGQTRKGIRQ